MFIRGEKIKIYSFLILAIGLFWGRICMGQETKKVLVLHIIEENWDDLEFYLPKYKVGRGGGPKPITKKEVFEKSEEHDYKENYKVYKENLGNAFANHDLVMRGKIEKVNKVKDRIKNSIKYSFSRGDFSKDAQLCVNHEMKYFGKAYLLKDEDTFMQDAFRIGGYAPKYSFQEIPGEILLLTDYLRDDPNLPIWDNFKYIRLVDDINIISSDEAGNLEIKYAGQNYLLKVGFVVELPVKEKNLTREEMKNYKNNYQEKWGNKIETMGDGNISSDKESFYFATKVSVINYGYVEIVGGQE